jgi:aminoglycoside phosphotransferase (APT) family kinase protein
MLTEKPYPDERHFLSVGRRLLQDQFPKLAALDCVPLAAGTDHRIYRIGPDLVLRLPKSQSTALQILKEHEWLGFLSGKVSLEIPFPVGLGQPTEYFPYPWSLYNFIKGQSGTNLKLVDTSDNASALALFVKSLRSCDHSRGPKPGQHNFGRGGPLLDRDADTLRAIDGLADSSGRTRATGIWTAAVTSSSQNKAVSWLHGDLQPGNVILRNKALTGVIDFGGLGVGDPACDLLPCWTIFSEKTRRSFCDGLDVDDDSWIRGKGWALTTAIVAYQYYKGKNDLMERQSLRTLKSVLRE